MTATRRVAVGRLAIVGEWAQVFCLTSPYAVAAQLGTVAEGLISYGQPAQSYKGQSGIKHGSMASASSSRPTEWIHLQDDIFLKRVEKGGILGGLLKM
ncbi:hypothetical protein BC826DRAFT_1030910 [Russula brevipes]|nr:hypothetical protein BC826DRAFT_1030910 [Russula brevipes]